MHKTDQLLHNYSEPTWDGQLEYGVTTDQHMYLQNVSTCCIFEHQIIYKQENIDVIINERPENLNM